MSVNEVELVRYTRIYKEFRALIAGGLISTDAQGAVIVEQPGNPRVIAFLKLPPPGEDMSRRAFVLYEIGQVIAEATVKNAPAAVTDAAQAFALSIPTMNEDQLAAAVAHFEGETGTKHGG
jgi:hypothetical protein